MDAIDFSQVGLGEKVSDSAAKCIPSYIQQTLKEPLLCLGIGQENINWEHKVEGHLENHSCGAHIVIQTGYHPSQILPTVLDK